MRIMTFNIQHALDYKNQRIDTKLFAEAVKKFGPDFCALNEVRGAGPLDGYTDQTAEITAANGYNGYFGQSILVGGTSPYGNALLSLGSLIGVETIIVPDPEYVEELDEDGDPIRYETRCIIKAVAEVEGKRICILVTHMGLASGERRNNIEMLCDIIDSVDMPVILCGDFNSTPDDPVFAPLYERLTDCDTVCVRRNMATYPSYSPEKKIDYIFFRGLECTACRVIEEVYADHLPIVADFELI